MKNVYLLGIITLIALCQTFGISKVPCNGCPESNLKKYYFTVDKILINNNELFVNISNQLMPINCLGQDDYGYYVCSWEDSSYCPGCGAFTWSEAFNCCLNPPSKCIYSCQSKFKR